MADQWQEHLRCPQCYCTGFANLAQPDNAEMPTVLGVAEGFKAVTTEYGPDFHCGTCNIPVIP